MDRSTPKDLQAAFARAPEAERKWLALADGERARYVSWADGPAFLQKGRIKGTVERVLWGRHQRGFWERMREGASTMGDQVGSGNYPPYSGAP